MSVISYRQQIADNPKLRAIIRSYLHVNGWLALRMTGERAFDPANASFTGLFGTLSNQDWSPRWCQYFDVDPTWLPPVVSGDKTLGQLRSRVAEEFGVPSSIPVKIGTGDTSCAMLGAGPVDLLHVVGTTQVLATLVANPQPHPERLTRLFGVGDAFVSVTHNPVGGAALDWMWQTCFRDQTESEFYGKTVLRAADRESSVILDPPFLGGDRLEIEAYRASFRDMTLATDRLDLLSAVLQAMRRGHQHAMQTLGASGPFRRIGMSGGAAEIVRSLIPEYATLDVQILKEGSLRGVAKLFRPQAD
jgi:xylulokinase